MKKYKKLNFELIGILLLVVLVVPNLAGAQPGGSPPSGNVDANFHTVTATSSTDTAGTFQGANGIRVEAIAPTGWAGFFADQTNANRVGLGLPSSAIDAIGDVFLTGTLHLRLNYGITGDDGPVVIWDDQGLTLKEENNNVFLQISSKGISNDYATNNGQVMIDDTSGLEIVNNGGTPGTGLLMRQDGSIRNNGSQNSGAVYVPDQLRVNAPANSHAIHATSNTGGYYAGIFNGVSRGIDVTTSDPNGTAGRFIGGTRGLSVEAVDGTGINVEGSNHGIYSQGMGAGGAGGIFRASSNIGIIASNDTYNSIFNAATPTTGISVAAPSTGGGTAISASNIAEGSQASIADDSHGIYVSAPNAPGPLGQYGVYSSGGSPSGFFSSGNFSALMATNQSAAFPTLSLTNLNTSGAALSTSGDVNVGGDLSADSLSSSGNIYASGTIYGSGVGRFYQTSWGAYSSVSPGSIGSTSRSCYFGDIAIGCAYWNNGGTLVPYTTYLSSGSNPSSCTVWWKNNSGTNSYSGRTAAMCFSPNG